MNEVPVLILFVTKMSNSNIFKVIKETQTKFKFFRNIHVLKTNDDRFLDKYTVDSVPAESDQQPQSETEIYKYLQSGAEIIPEVSSYAEETNRDS